jgi:hypothetical protein
MKKDSEQVTAKVLSRKVFITTIASILLSIVIYSFITPGAMNFNIHETIRFFLKMIVTALVIGPFAALAVLGFFRPVAKVIRISKKANKYSRTSFSKREKP